MTTADEGAFPESGDAPRGGMSTMTFILIVVALTLLAAGVGFFGGMQILASVERSLREKAAETEVLAGELQTLNGDNVQVLPPIVTNLAGHEKVWIRLEGSLVFRSDVPDDAEALAATVAKDIVAFLRTISVDQLEGGIGFQHLSEDLNDRVRVRSNGRVQELIIQGLIIE